MFISSYTTIYFFVKKFIFSNAYNSVNTIFESEYPYMFFGRERGRQISTYAAGWGMGRVIQNAYKCVQGDGNVMSHVYLHTYTISFHVFGKIFAL